MLYLVRMSSSSKEPDVPKMVTDEQSDAKVVDTGPQGGGELLLISIDIHYSDPFSNIVV